MSEVIIKYLPNGKVEIEAVGFKDSTCLQATSAFEKALGLKKVERRMKTASELEAEKAGVRNGSRNSLYTRR